MIPALFSAVSLFIVRRRPFESPSLVLFFSRGRGFGAHAVNLYLIFRSSTLFFYLLSTFGSVFNLNLVAWERKPEMLDQQVEMEGRKGNSCEQGPKWVMKTNTPNIRRWGV